MKYLIFLFVFLSLSGKAQIVFEHSPIIMGENVSTPSGYSMYVKKGIISEKITIAASDSPDWADYVFDEDYFLLELPTLEKYIQKNKHLPKMPTQKDIQENGNNLHQTDVKLLEKIEEMTLYIIQLNKRIEELEKRVNSEE